MIPYETESEENFPKPRGQKRRRALAHDVRGSLNSIVIDIDLLEAISSSSEPIEKVRQDELECIRRIRRSVARLSANLQELMEPDAE
jgi:hypothetical protein